MVSGNHPRDLSFYQTHTSGDLIERVDGDVTLLADFFLANNAEMHDLWEGGLGEPA